MMRTRAFISLTVAVAALAIVCVCVAGAQPPQSRRIGKEYPFLLSK